MHELQQFLAISALLWNVTKKFKNYRRSIEMLIRSQNYRPLSEMDIWIFGVNKTVWKHKITF